MGNDPLYASTLHESPRIQIRLSEVMVGHTWKEFPEYWILLCKSRNMTCSSRWAGAVVRSMYLSGIEWQAEPLESEAHAASEFDLPL